MSENLWRAVEDRAPATPGKDRSGYIRSLVEADLAKAGMMPGDPQAEVMAAVAIVGTQKALAVLRKAARSTKATEQKEAA